jgi:hypothetical protein
VVLVGDAQNRQQRHETTRQAILGLLTDGITVLGEELGRSLVNADGHGIEQFGYVDGRSQPLFLDEDNKDETDEQDGTDNWDPAFPLGQVIAEGRSVLLPLIGLPGPTLDIVRPRTATAAAEHRRVAADRERVLRHQEASRARIRRRAVLLSATGTSRPALPSPNGRMLL